MSELAEQSRRAAKRPSYEFIAEWFKNWWGLMGCALFTLISLYAAGAEKSNAWVVRAGFAAAVVMFFVASFQAWKRQYDAANKAAEMVSRLEAAVCGGDPVLVPASLRCVQKVSAPVQPIAEKRHAQFIVSNFAGVTAREIHFEFTSPAGHILTRVTVATHHDSVEARNNSSMPVCRPRGLYGCTVFLQAPPTEKTLLTLYVTSDEPLQIRSVDAGAS